jgi:DNA-directed RNA polymerase specialized sigma24 family protein
MTGSRPLDEEALLIAARSGAEEFSAFYRHFERSMLGFFMRATGQADLAADLTAETFARALESVATYDPAKGRADQWLLGIARHVLSGSYRRGRVDAAARERLGLPRLILDDHATETISRLAAGQDEATNALAELSQEQRRAARLGGGRPCPPRRPAGGHRGVALGPARSHPAALAGCAASPTDRRSPARSCGASTRPQPPRRRSPCHPVATRLDSTMGNSTI